MVGESNQNLFLIQIDASNLAEFEISELEISRFYCISVKNLLKLKSKTFQVYEDFTDKFRTFYKSVFWLQAVYKQIGS